MQAVEEASNTSFQRDSCDVSFTKPYELTDLRSRRFRSKMRIAEQPSHHSSNSNNASNAEDNVNSLVNQWDRQRSRSRAAQSESVNIGRRNSIESAKPLVYEIKTFKEIKREARSRFFPGGTSVRSNSQESLGVIRDTMNVLHEDSAIQEEEFEGRETYNGCRNSEGLEHKNNAEENQDNVLTSTNEEDIASAEEKKTVSKAHNLEMRVDTIETVEQLEMVELKEQVGKIEQEVFQAAGNKTVQSNVVQHKHRKSKVIENPNVEGGGANFGVSLKRENTKNAPAKTVKKNILSNLVQSSLDESAKAREKATGKREQIRQEKTASHQNSLSKANEPLKVKKDVNVRKSGIASKPNLFEPSQESGDARLGRPKTANPKLFSASQAGNSLAKEKAKITLTLNDSFHEQNEPLNTSFDLANTGASINYTNTPRDKSEDPQSQRVARSEINRTTPSTRAKSQRETPNALSNKAVKQRALEKETHLFAIAEAKKKTKKAPPQTENSSQIATQKTVRAANPKMIIASSTKTLPKKDQDSKKNANLPTKQAIISNNAQTRPATAKDPKATSAAKPKPLVSKPKPQIDPLQGSNTNSTIPSPKLSIMKNETPKLSTEEQVSHHTADLMQRVQKQVKEDLPTELESIPEKLPKKTEPNKINQKHKITEGVSKAFDY